MCYMAQNCTVLIYLSINFHVQKCLFTTEIIKIYKNINIYLPRKPVIYWGVRYKNLHTHISQKNLWCTDSTTGELWYCLVTESASQISLFLADDSQVPIRFPHGQYTFLEGSSLLFLYQAPPLFGVYLVGGQPLLGVSFPPCFFPFRVLTMVLHALQLVELCSAATWHPYPNHE